jgi:hypothetical protein
MVDHIWHCIIISASNGERGTWLLGRRDQYYGWGRGDDFAVGAVQRDWCVSPEPAGRGRNIAAKVSAWGGWKAAKRAGRGAATTKLLGGEDGSGHALEVTRQNQSNQAAHGILSTKSQVATHWPRAVVPAASKSEAKSLPKFAMLHADPSRP